MNIRWMLTLSALVGLGLSQAAAQTTLKKYTCTIVAEAETHASGFRIQDHLFPPVFHEFSATTLEEAKKKALADAKQELGNQEVVAVCYELRTDRPTL